ncbi:MAG TPA: hypothetical protein VH637_00925 [Streptosporangiaceae bacterium]
MYSAGPPGADQGGGPLRLAVAGSRVFDGSSACALDPQLRVYLSDMIRPYQLALREDLLAAGAGQCYGEMAGALLAQLPPGSPPADLVVMAFAVSDVIPGRSTAAHLAQLCPGSPAAFAVCDQGTAAPFTALRLIREYARSGSCQRALLVVVEQAAMHYELAAPAPVPDQHAAVALWCGGTGPGQLAAVWQQAGLAPGQAASLLASQVAELCAGRDEVTLVTGSGLAAAGLAAGLGGAVRLRAAAPGQPLTGPWAALAAGLPGWAAAGQRVLVADYDPVLGYLCVSALDVGAGQANGGGQDCPASVCSRSARTPTT